LHRIERELFLGREHGGQSIVLPRREQARWIGLQMDGPLVPAKVQFRWRLAGAVLRGPLSAGEKIACLAFLCGKSSFRKLLRGRLTGSYTPARAGNSCGRSPSRSSPNE
jgi:hypothetical protein